MKGELQELGEDTEGIESISKIQTQILNLTNNKVNIFDSNNNFKSTYEILKEISEIYFDLSDTSRADLTEILFGKNRANQGTAILQAFQSGQIQAAYDAATHAAGSAQAEFDKWSESIEAHINNFQEAWQNLSKDLIDSDLLKNAIDFGTSAVDILDAIIDKAGLLSTAIGGITLVSAFKGNSLFSVMADESDELGISFNVLHKRFKDIISDYKSVTDDKIGVKKLKAAFSGVLGEKVSPFNDGDVERVKNYFDVLNSTKDKSIALQTALDGASAATKKIAVSSETATIALETMETATTSVTAAEKAATIATEALNIGIKALYTVGITLAVSAIVKGITTLIQKEKEAQEQAEEARRNATETAESYKKEADSLDGIITQYSKLVTSTTDTASAKDNLLSIQDQLVEKYGEEAKALDIVNGKYSENLKAMRELRKEEAQNLIDEMDRTNAYTNALNDSVSTTSIVAKGFGGWDKDTRLAWEALDKNNQIGYTYNATYGSSYNILQISGSLKEQRDLLNQMILAYKQLNPYDEDRLKVLNDELAVLDERIKQNDAVIEQYESAKNTIAQLNIPDDVSEQFGSLADEVVATSQKLNELSANGGDTLEIYEQNKNLDELHQQLIRLSADYPELREQTDELFESISNSSAKTAKSITDTFELLDEQLKGSFSSTLGTVDKVQSTMQKLANGEGLDWDEFKELSWDIDTEGMLGMFEEVDGKWQLVSRDYRDLIALKDWYINKEKEAIEAEKEEIETNLKLAATELATAKAKYANYLSSPNASVNSAEAKRMSEAVTTAEKEYDKINRELRESNYALDHLNGLLGDTVDKTQVISAIQSDISKAQEEIEASYKKMAAEADSNITALTKQKDAIEEAKTALEKQLEVLEKQQAALEETIKNYEKVADIVSDSVNAEIDKLETQRKAEEDSYNQRIEEYKKANEEKETENSLAEKQLDLQQKIRKLEEAKNNKVRTYSSEQGWHYEANKETVANAQNEVNEAKKALDKALQDKEYNDRIAQLEAERDAAVKVFDDQIDAYNEYLDSWKDAIQEQVDAENELIANEILGLDWREKITQRDMSMLTNYETEYKNYKDKLSSLVNGEIDSLKKAITARENEMKEKQKQIDSWNKYKDSLREAADSAKNSLQTYSDALNSTADAEKSVFDRMTVNMWNFKEVWGSYAQEAINKAIALQSALSGVDSGNYLDWAKQELANRITNPLLKRVLVGGSHANGGVVDYTGLAAVHGKKSSSETVFNATQSKDLWDMVRTGNFSELVAQKAIQGFKGAMNTNTYNSNNAPSITIQQMDINGVQNPIEFARQFECNMEQYWRVKLSESRVK